jgi:hypothetical protein
MQFIQILQQIDQLRHELRKKISTEFKQYVTDSNYSIEERFHTYCQCLEYLPQKIIPVGRLEEYLPNTTFYYGTGDPGDDSNYEISLVYDYSCKVLQLDLKKRKALMKRIMKLGITHVYSCERDSEYTDEYDTEE